MISNIRGLPFRHHRVGDRVALLVLQIEEHLFVPEVDFDNSALHVSSF